MARRKPHHPPDPGPYQRPDSPKPRLFNGAAGVAGFGCRDFYVAAVPRDLACRIIVERHYSGRIVNNSYVHLGVFVHTRMLGVLQFGYALNPARADKVVAGTTSIDYLELNRMWLDDAAPRNSESRAIACAFRYIRAAMPHVRWVQSFADERCGQLGVVYQACNFLYVGCHLSRFYELDGEFYHKINITAAKRGGQRSVRIRRELHRAVRHDFAQYRYVFFLHKGARRHLRLPVQPYPKPRNRGRSVGTRSGTPRPSRVRSPATAP